MTNDNKVNFFRLYLGSDTKDPCILDENVDISNYEDYLIVDVPQAYKETFLEKYKHYLSDDFISPCYMKGTLTEIPQAYKERDLKNNE